MKKGLQAKPKKTTTKKNCYNYLIFLKQEPENLNMNKFSGKTFQSKSTFFLLSADFMEIKVAHNTINLSSALLCKCFFKSKVASL